VGRSLQVDEFARNLGRGKQAARCMVNLGLFPVPSNSNSGKMKVGVRIPEPKHVIILVVTCCTYPTDLDSR